MKSIEQNLLKKSQSLCPKSNRSILQNPEQQNKKSNLETHLEQLILQKYNFQSNLKYQFNSIYARKRVMNTTTMFPSSNMILVAKLPEINHTTPIQSSNNQIGYKSLDKSNSPKIYPNYAYDVINYNKRKTSDYKQCKKRIQMNTTYRGFNFNKEKSYQQKRNLNNQKSNKMKNQPQYINYLKPAQRKLIINYIIQKGYAKKKQQELNKFRNQKKKNYQQNISSKKSKAISPLKVKRSVIFSKLNIFKTQSEAESLKLKMMEQQILPW